jgi:large subunit ribosomal protein L11
MDFCKQFNEATKDKVGFVIPVIVEVYEDRTFSFITKTPPASNLIKKELGIESGSGAPNKQKVGKLTKDQLRKIAEIKMPDLNAKSIEAAMKIIAGTARNMGVEVEE